VLTRESILAMEPGRELDALVAEKVMDIPIIWRGPYVAGGPLGLGTPHKYSTDMSAAWEVVEKFDKNTFNLNWLDGSNIYGIGWHCKLGNEHAHKCSTPTEAICKAALLTTLEDDRGEKEKAPKG